MENIDFESSEWYTDQENKIIYRLLQIEDLDESYFKLLGQLTSSPYPLDLAQNDAEKQLQQDRIKKQFEELAQDPNHVILVAVAANNIVGTASLVVEKKFIRNLAKAGHIEDVVVDSSTRGKGVGKKLIQLLTECKTQQREL